MPRLIGVIVDDRFDRLTGLLVEIADQTGKFPVHQDLLYYPGMVGNNSRFEFRASGAYIFRPNGTALPTGNTSSCSLELSRILWDRFRFENNYETVVTGSISQLVTVDGPVVTEIYQEFSDWSSQIIRLIPGQPYVEFDWIVGPIPVKDNVGKEIITRFTVKDMKTRGIFYTDSNGREILPRKINFQPSYQVEVTEPESGNYYPVNSVAYVEDVLTGRRMAVLNDRAQGASSLQEGSLEFMVIQSNSIRFIQLYWFCVYVCVCVKASSFIIMEINFVFFFLFKFMMNTS